jgi:alpha-mannosidase
MTVRRASAIVPSRRLEDFPTHLTGERAAELLSAWTVLWHPALIDATSSLPGWRSTDDLPDPSEFDGELVVVPTESRHRLAADWCDRLRATSPRNPPPVEAVASRAQTMDAVLSAVGLGPELVATETVADFLALGQVYLQVELLTRAMHYTTVLDAERFTSATVAAARAAVAGNKQSTQEELARAFDLLTDARNHVYAVDFFVVDLTLLAASTLGECLRTKLASGSPTSLLAHGELLDQMAREYPTSLAELRRAMEAGTACVVGGAYHSAIAPYASPEELLDELSLGQDAARRHLGQDYKVFGQFRNVWPPLLVQILARAGFQGVLYASFDGGRLPRSDQCKTWLGPGDGLAIEALATTPLDAACPETWIKLPERIGDTIAHDHVATILLASWPGTESEFFDDLRRASKFGPLLGKFVTLEEYFRITRQPDEWTSLDPREQPARLGTELSGNPISSQIEAYRTDVLKTHRRLAAGIATAVALPLAESGGSLPPNAAVLNPWNFEFARCVGVDPLNPLVFNDNTAEPPRILPGVPGCGFATLAAAAPIASVSLADGRTLRNERLEVTISESTGGIQSVRMHRDRGTRSSQRLVFYQGSGYSPSQTQMVADEVQITRNDTMIGEIESRGRLLDSAGEVLASFRQCVRITRGLPAVIVEVELEPKRLPEGDVWRSYFASRLAWSDEAISVRRGLQWMGRETAGERIESPEWVEINDGIGTVTCFGLGLAFHRRSSPTWLDTLLLVAGEEMRRFQFAIAVDEAYPTQTALGLLTAGQGSAIQLPVPPPSSRGWFLHVGARNIVVTHIESLALESKATRLRLLETEGRDSQTTLTAFRPFSAARTTDFLGNSTGVLSVNDGRVEFDIGAHRWIQIEAEW